MTKFSYVTAVTALTMALALAPFAAQAQTVNQRLRNQHSRIHQGVKSGQLSRHEANVVRTDDKVIHNEEKFDRLTDHGRLTNREKSSLNRQLNRNSRRIYRLKHNGATRQN